MVFMNTVYRLNTGQSRCACFDLMIATLNIAFQLMVPHHQELATFIYKYISQALINNLQLVIFNVVKLFSFGVTELGDMVSLITAFRENVCVEICVMRGKPIGV